MFLSDEVPHSVSGCLVSSGFLTIPVFLSDEVPHSVSGCLVSGVLACLTSASDYSVP